MGPVESQILRGEGGNGGDFVRLDTVTLDGVLNLKAVTGNLARTLEQQAKRTV
jgi:hypothetical protein